MIANEIVEKYIYLDQNYFQHMILVKNTTYRSIQISYVFMLKKMDILNSILSYLITNNDVPVTLFENK